MDSNYFAWRDETLEELRERLRREDELARSKCDDPRGHFFRPVDEKHVQCIRCGECR